METVWDWVSFAVSALVASLGTVYLYRRNGGENSPHFLQRYLAINWVVGLRCLVGLSGLYALLLVGMFFFDFLEEISDGVINALGILVEVIIFWRTAHHIGDVAERVRVVQAE